MTVGDIKEKLGLKALCENEDSLSREVTGGYCGDLLSLSLIHISEPTRH